MPRKSSKQPPPQVPLDFDALLDKVQEFLPELGYGFCFLLGSEKPERGHGCEAY